MNPLSFQQKVHWFTFFLFLLSFKKFKIVDEYIQNLEPLQ